LHHNSQPIVLDFYQFTSNANMLAAFQSLNSLELAVSFEKRSINTALAQPDSLLGFNCKPMGDLRFQNPINRNDCYFLKARVGGWVD
jgi:hypothetical protein